MPFDLRDIPIDPKVEAALAARGLSYRVVDPRDRAALAAWSLADIRGFHNPAPTEADLEREIAVFVERRVHGVYDPTLDVPEVPVATVASWPTGLSVPGGRSVDGWAVSSVTVAATHRRRGVARALMEGELHNAVAAGAAVAMLTATEARAPIPGLPACTRAASLVWIDAVRSPRHPARSEGRGRARRTRSRIPRDRPA